MGIASRSGIVPVRLPDVPRGAKHLKRLYRRDDAVHCQNDDFPDVANGNVARVVIFGQGINRRRKRRSTGAVQAARGDAFSTDRKSFTIEPAAANGGTV
jgi:hypothetical protein